MSNKKKQKKSELKISSAKFQEIFVLIICLGLITAGIFYTGYSLTHYEPPTWLWIILNITALLIIIETSIITLNIHNYKNRDWHIYSEHNKLSSRNFNKTTKQKKGDKK